MHNNYYSHGMIQDLYVTYITAVHQYATCQSNLYYVPPGVVESEVK